MKRPFILWAILTLCPCASVLAQNSYLVSTIEKTEVKDTTSTDTVIVDTQTAEEKFLRANFPYR